jgi:hypothetical protein
MHVPLVVKGGTVCGREWFGNFAEKMPFYAIYISFTCLKSATWGKWLYFPSEGRHAEYFFALKIRRLQPEANQQSWVPEDSMLTTRTQKQLNCRYKGTNVLCTITAN